MKHLVTGGSGFLGNLIARRLLERGEDVKILDIKNAVELSNTSVKLSNFGDHKSSANHAKESVEMLQN